MTWLQALTFREAAEYVAAAEAALAWVTAIGWWARRAPSEEDRIGGQF